MPVASLRRLLLIAVSVLVVLAGTAAAPSHAGTSERAVASERASTTERTGTHQKAGAQDRKSAGKKKANKKASKASKKASKKGKRARNGQGKGGGKGKGGSQGGAVETPAETPADAPADSSEQPAAETATEPQTPAEPAAEASTESQTPTESQTSAEPQTPDQPVAESPSGTYFVDPQSGSDSHAGTSPTRAWRTLSRATEATLAPGESLLLRAGARHVGSLTVTESGTAGQPLLIGSYGTGALPVVSEGDCVRIRGDWVRVTAIHAAECQRAGFHVEGADITVTAVEASGSVAGVWVRPGARRAAITDSYIHDNIHMAPGTDGPDDDYGAFGIEVNGDHTRVTGNRISGHVALSPDYGRDGAAVEVFQAVDTVVTGNTSTDDLAFTELGGSRTSATRIANNSVTSSLADAAFLMTRGPGQVWGPVTDTLAQGNVVALSGKGSFGFGCYGGCTASHLVMRDNTISAGWYVGWVDGSFTSTGNTYRGELWFPLGAGDRHLG